jgi:hypothetical protein
MLERDGYSQVTEVLMGLCGRFNVVEGQYYG